MAEHRAGVVALLGRPNAGKSTLLNRLLGQKLAIVTAKPQTTRSRILGISTLPDAQILWLDTPGLHAGRRPLNRALNAIALAAAEDCDLALLLVDPAQGRGQGPPPARRPRSPVPRSEAQPSEAGAGQGPPPAPRPRSPVPRSEAQPSEAGAGLDPELASFRERLVERGTPVLVVETKADLHPAGMPSDLRVSARSGEGIDALLAAVVARLPAAPPYYDDPEQLTDRSLRWLAAECVREAVFEELEQELPYATAVEVESFDESSSDCVRIRAQLLVERASQKRIVIGAAGEQIKRIGIRARAALERLLETRVHLALWVKVEPDWPKRRKRLEALGYR